MQGASGQQIAFDDAAGPSYANGWTNGTNGGNGFEPWVFSVGANTGMFIGDPANNGMKTEGIGTTAFAMFATGTAYANARRPFKAEMQPGDELTFYWAINFDAKNGSKGFDFKSGTNTVFNVNNGGNDDITTTSGTAFFEYGTNPVFVKLKRLNAENYTLTLTGRDGIESYSTNINSTRAVNAIDFYIGNQGDGLGERNMYFNKFIITSATSSTRDIMTSASSRIFPNPVQSGSNLMIEFEQDRPGKYTMNLFHVSGMRVKQYVWNHIGGKQVQSLPVPAGLASGLYLIEMEVGGKKSMSRLIIQ
jgi:hypothetical protein